MSTDPHDRDDQAPIETTPFADAVTMLLRRALRRSRQELSKAADTSRRRLELRQKRKDLDHFWVRLGKTAHRLAEAGEIEHPALQKAMTRIAELETELEDWKAANGDVAHHAESE